jgi:hypothetical protein
MEFIVVAVLLVGGLALLSRSRGPSSGVPPVLVGDIADPSGSGPVPGTGGGSTEADNPTWVPSAPSMPALSLPGMAGTALAATTVVHPTAVPKLNLPSVSRGPAAIGKITPVARSIGVPRSGLTIPSRKS